MTLLYDVVEDKSSEITVVLKPWGVIFAGGAGGIVVADVSPDDSDVTELVVDEVLSDGVTAGLAETKMDDVVTVDVAFVSKAFTEVIPVVVDETYSAVFEVTIVGYVGSILNIVVSSVGALTDAVTLSELSVSPAVVLLGLGTLTVDDTSLVSRVISMDDASVRPLGIVVGESVADMVVG